MRTRRPKQSPCLVSGDIECRIYIKRIVSNIFDILLLNGEALINGLSTMLGSPFLFVFCFAYNLIKYLDNRYYKPIIRFNGQFNSPLKRPH